MESPRLGHLLGVNGFFTALAGHARHHPEEVLGPDGVGGLTSWLSERRFADTFFLTGATEAGVRPDGYGCWEAHGRAVRFFLEYDTGTESQPTLTSKLAAYTDFGTGEHGILLFSVHSARREAHLHQALTRALPGHGRPGRADRAGLVIATTSRDLGHPDGPAGPVWALWDPARTGPPRRLRLGDLPQRGPAPIHHRPAADLPFSHADYDPDQPNPDHTDPDHTDPPHPGHVGRRGTDPRPGDDWDSDGYTDSGDYWGTL